MSYPEEFLNSFHKEKLLAIQQRSRYVQLKIGFIIGILGLGSLGIQNILLNQSIPVINSSLILIITPIVAIGYDYYINGSDHSIKRMGAFVRQNPLFVSEIEYEWEKFVIKKRGTYAPRANLIFSLIATIASCILLIFSFHSLNYSFIYILSIVLYFLMTIIFIVYIFTQHKKLVEEYDQPPKSLIIIE